MGMDPVTLALISSALVEGGSQIYGAVSNNHTNNANLNAALQNRQMLQGYANKMMQPGTNPFAQSIMNFIGQGQNLGTNANSFQPYNNSPSPQGQAPSPNPTQGTGQAPGNNGDNNPSAFNLVPTNRPIYPNGMSGIQPVNAQAPMSQPGMANAFGVQAPPVSSPNGMVGDASGTPFASLIPGVEVQNILAGGGSYIGAPMSSNVTGNGYLGYPSGQVPPQAQALIAQGMQPGTVDFNNALIQAIVATGAPHATLQNYATLAQQAATQPAQMTQSPNAAGATQYLENGIYYDGSGNPIGTQGQNGMIPGVPAGTPSIDPRAPVDVPPAWNQPGLPPGWDSPVSGGGGQYNAPGMGNGAGVGGDNTTGGMYVYQPRAASTYNPALLHNAPTISAAQSTAASAFNPLSITGAQASAPNLYNPQMIGSSQGQNAGQDSLFQMMRSNLSPSLDPSITSNLADISSGNTQFNNSDLFKAMNASAQNQLDQQVGQVRGAAGSLGERFGTAINQNESLLRSQVQNQLNLQNAQVAQSSFENAQNRRLQSLGLASTNQQNLNQFNLAGAQLSQNAASQYAGNQNQISLANQSTGLQAGLAGQDILSRLSQFNAGNVQQANLANQSTGLQAGLQNQNLQTQNSQFNASNQQQASTANQNTLMQLLLSNQNAANTAGQFNATQSFANNQLNASQGNQYNNLILQALGMAGNAQGQQNSQNAQLLGILAGIGVPQAQPNQIPGAVGDTASTLGMIPLLQSILGKGAAAYAPSSYSPSPYAQYGVNA